MHPIKHKLGAALVGAFTVAGTPGRAESTRDQRVDALEEIREGREGTRTATSTELPALRRAMQPTPTRDAELFDAIAAGSPTGRRLVDLLTATTDAGVEAAAEALATDILAPDGHAAEKLFVTQTNVARVAQAGLYDVPARARVTYVDTLIVTSLTEDARAELVGGDLAIAGLTAGAALWGGLHGTRRLARLARGIHWSSLVGDAGRAAGQAPGRLARKGLSAVSTAYHAVRGTNRAAGLAHRTVAEVASLRARAIARRSLESARARGSMLRREARRFDAVSALIDGGAVGVPAFTAWRLGHAFGAARGEDLAATHLEAMIPNDRREPLELEPSEAGPGR